jgi:hypothetical protein
MERDTDIETFELVAAKLGARLEAGDPLDTLLRTYGEPLQRVLRTALAQTRAQA